MHTLVKTGDVVGNFSIQCSITKGITGYPFFKLNRSDLNKIKQLPTTANIENLSLAQLSEAANREAQSGDEAFVKGLEHYRRCGEYLIAAKAKGKAEIGAGFRWSVWLKENWKKSYQVAARYMQLATSWENLSTSRDFHQDMGVQSALKLLSVQPETIEVEVIEKEIVRTETKEVKVDNPELKGNLTKAEKTIKEQQASMTALNTETQQLRAIVEGLQEELEKKEAIHSVFCT